MARRWFPTKSGGETARFLVWVSRDIYDLAREYAKRMNRDQDTNWSVADALGSMLQEGAQNVGERLDDEDSWSHGEDEDHDA